MVSHSPTSPIKVLLVDDHAVVRAGLVMLLQSQKHLKVIGQTGDTIEALKIAADAQPDVILLDVILGSDDGLELLPKLRKAAHNARILILTGTQNPEVYQRAVRLGAMGLVNKETAAEVLLKAIEKINAGEVWFDRMVMGDVLTEMTRGRDNKKADPEAAKITKLTEREREIIVLIAEGLKNKQIAERMFISETTVRHHLTSVFNKLSVADRLELMIYAFRHKLVAPAH
ncbi:MAG: response regulator transcription factor [Pyrinomonadaceae bacterium]|jgi:DNA-binding NarL/FixJ family response regulator|nr:response regulator transcription factor [Pyrinomonadaceae bacterium]